LFKDVVLKNTQAHVPENGDDKIPTTRCERVNTLSMLTDV